MIAKTLKPMNWIRKTFEDERGNPSTNRQMAAFVLIAGVIMAFTGYEDNLVEVVLVCGSGILLGTQIPKIFKNEVH